MIARGVAIATASVAGQGLVVWGMVRAFVAGATGHTGRAVVAALRSRGAETLAHVRPDSSRLAHWRHTFEAAGAKIDTTAWTSGAMRERLSAIKPTHVFALLGTTRRRAAGEGLTPEEAYEQIDYGLSVMLLDAAERGGSTPRFVYLSAAGLSENTRNPYMRVRVRVEQALIASPLPYISARPSFIVGPRDEARMGEAVAARAIDAALAVVGALGGRRWADRYRSTTGAVLGEALVRVALDPGTPRAYVAESESLR